jgi:hypothetical protein
MEPLAQDAIRFGHLGDLRKHGAFPVRLVRARARGCLLRSLLGGGLGASDSISHFVPFPDSGRRAIAPSLTLLRYTQ